HARAVADLQVYLRQHHGHRDDTRLGAALLTGETDGGWTW
ncbi:acyl-CoA hydrolase, partial [Micrococcus sp. HSID17227]